MEHLYLKRTGIATQEKKPKRENKKPPHSERPI